MILGLFLRHYKIYQGVNFIPICNDYSNKYSVFIGNNGVGKSSVLEALDTFFNNAYWNKYKGGKSDEAFIAPVFLIEKEKVKEKFYNEPLLQQFIEFLSDYFWNVTTEVNGNLTSEEFKKFFEYRDYMKENKQDKKLHLFILGIFYENKSKVNFITFNNDVKEKIPEELKHFDYNCLIDKIRELYSYVYIPVQTTPSQVLKIEGKEIQELLNTDILNKVDSLLNEKIFQNARRKMSVIDFLNTSLNDYMDSINEIIEKMDSGYAYKVEGTYKKNLTSSDVRKKILEAYFSIRTLKKDKQEIEELSSGEQRIALIDIATAFLLNSENTHKCIIFAIDEPENSLHISKAFNQFERLQKLSNKHQIMITTHWYGSLPITNTGSLQYLEKNRKIKIYSYNFSNYFENRRQLPEDVMLKSYFELTASILSSMRSDKTNWIICEGSDDKLYLEYYLKNIKNLRIFNVGGCGNVAKLYSYLYIPLSEKEESKSLEGKILCIIDTDDELKTIDIESQTKNKKLRIVRIQENRENKIEFKKLEANGYYNPTEMEDCLQPKPLYDALIKTITEIGAEEQINVIQEFDFNSDIEISRIKGGDTKTILKPKTLDAIYKKHIIEEAMDNCRFKYLLAENYIKEIESKRAKLGLFNILEDDREPELFRLIEEYFNEN